MGIPSTSRRRVELALALGLVFLTWIAWADVLDLALLGWDTYPLIAAGRIDGPGEWFSTFGEKLMDGRYPLGDYWRPVVHLSFALDHALHGLDPRGYHLTDLILLSLAGIGVARLATRYAGGTFAGLVAGIFWILHPVQFEVLSVAARRAEMLSLLWTVLALDLVPLRGPLRPRRAWLLGCLCALALASKETGALALPLVLLAIPRVASTGNKSVGMRFRAALPILFPSAATFLMRTWVLGGLGGAEGTLEDPHSIWDAPVVLARQASRALFPSLFGLANHPAPPWTAWLAPCALLCALLLGRSLARRRQASHMRSPMVRVIVPWFLLLVLITLFSPVDQPWYTLPFVAPLAVGLGALAQWSARACVHKSPGAPTSHATLLLGAAGTLAALAPIAALSLGSYTPREARRDAADASERVAAFLHEFSERIATSQPGAGMSMQASFEWVRVDGDGKPLRRVHGFAPYSLEAYADLAHPGRRVRVGSRGIPSRRPEHAGDLVVEIVWVPWTRMRGPR